MLFSFEVNNMIKNVIRSLPILLALTFLPQQNLSALNTSEYLIVESGEEIKLSGVIYKSVSIQVKPGGIIRVPPYDGNENFGKLNLIAPNILIEGVISAFGAAYNDNGCGGAPQSTNGGGGGAGYGGKGGRGDGNDSDYGSGGDIYNTPLLVDTGSYGWRAGFSNSASGFGGGSIRLDAISLTLGATARLLAMGNPDAFNTVGGGSGGGILLNGIHACLLKTGTAYYLDVSGGPGGGQDEYEAAGGGGGGRIKFIKHPSFEDQGGTILLDGGPSGGGDAEAGEPGKLEVTSAPMPNPPDLISPDNGQEVGVLPTFIFGAADPADSKFLKYKLEISLNPFPSPVSITANQLTEPEDPGWRGKPFFFSREEASYAVQYALDTSTDFFWQVWVTNNEGVDWICSEEQRQFTTMAQINSRPLQPQQLQPLHDQINVSKTPAFQTLCVDPDGDTLTCKIILSKNPELSNPQIFGSSYSGWDQTSYLPEGAYAGITATCQVLNSGDDLDALLPGTNYYWIVQVYDAYQQSNFSENIYHFTTVARPPAPTVDSPLDQETVTTKTPSLKIASQSPTNGPLYYKIELSSDSFQTMVVFTSENGGGWSKSSYTSTEIAELVIPAAYALVPGITYTWQAYAYDIDNDNWSPVTGNISFTVITPPLLPQLLFPDDAYAAPNASLTFQFTAESESGNTLNGRLELSEDDFLNVWRRFDQTQDHTGWSSPDYQSNSIMAFTLPSSLQLERGSTYWWRTYATDGISWGPASASRSFSLTRTLEFQQVRAVPNPAVSTSTLEIHFRLSVDAHVTIRFYNKLGKEVDQFHAPALGGAEGNIFKYDISRYASGIYFYVIEARSIFGIRKTTGRFAIVN